MEDLLNQSCFFLSLIEFSSYLEKKERSMKAVSVFSAFFFFRNYYKSRKEKVEEESGKRNVQNFFDFANQLSLCHIIIIYGDSVLHKILLKNEKNGLLVALLNLPNYTKNTIKLPYFLSHKWELDI
ncbi:hypothetical protein BpHYR1_031629 [Brachionus plicatilis]|uniref:Uncharacterized protein n=1 Tax=Brachionus plicatilis TaxID=10195 RepID=A0A3M7S4I9_BRAPC|nr:hypothetical protein BpHYR1_031629 [Brachionus plicatilis]